MYIFIIMIKYLDNYLSNNIFIKIMNKFIKKYIKIQEKLIRIIINSFKLFLIFTFIF